ncbi:Protein CBG24014 [Caenorhabditis briggsae]|nr:Protein CBG24014 [Caenorhabditis briggsae]CAP20721.2 Protein CBG24014 [Caenorhabditis briggsae]
MKENEKLDFEGFE